MQYYQLTYLVSPNFSEEEVKTLQEQINVLITERQGILDKIRNFGKKNLEVLIKNFSQAYLIELNFYLDPEKIENLKTKIKEKNDILRFLILKQKITKQPLKNKKRVLVPTIRQKKPKSFIRKQAKVELKEIDKKLEEILNE